MKNVLVLVMELAVEMETEMGMNDLTAIASATYLMIMNSLR